MVDFELFRSELEMALERSDRWKGGRPPYDAVLMFKVLFDHLQGDEANSDPAAQNATEVLRIEAMPSNTARARVCTGKTL